MMNIGIMGGTFNPIHIGHLIAAEEVLNKMNLDKIIFIPSGNPPHKVKSELAEANHRLQMVKLATHNNESFSLSDIEINREGMTYTYDTLLELHEIYEDSEMFFIIGYDTLKELYSWKSIAKVCKLCTFIVVTRSNDKYEMEDQIIKMKDNYKAEILVVDIPNIEISSTYIRKKLSMGNSVKYLVGEAVEEYINKYGLYKGV